MVGENDLIVGLMTSSEAHVHAGARGSHDPGINVEPKLSSRRLAKKAP